MTDTINITSFVCPVPLRRYPQIVMGHGSGGQMMNELIEHLFAPAFADTEISEPLSDAAVLDLSEVLSDGSRLAFSADSFVVSPPIFPGGDIGSLAVHGTVNDLAMMGARPLYLSVGFIIEEGLAVDDFEKILQSMKKAAEAGEIRIVTGDTKVVERGKCDGIYINTSGIGEIDRTGINAAISTIQLRLGR